MTYRQQSREWVTHKHHRGQWVVIVGYPRGDNWEFISCKSEDHALEVRAALRRALVDFATHQDERRAESLEQARQFPFLGPLIDQRVRA